MSSTTTTPKLPIVYVGPTSSKLGLVRLHHYIEPLNDVIQEAIDKNPALGKLFIPLEEFGTRAQAIYSGKDAVVRHLTHSLTKQEIL